jgi:hypothetical protein
MILAITPERIDSFDLTGRLVNTVLPASLHPDSAISWHFKTKNLKKYRQILGFPRPPLAEKINLQPKKIT